MAARQPEPSTINDQPGTAMNHAVVLRETGAPSVLRYEQTQTPSAGPGEAVVRHEAVGINFVDTMVRTGRYRVALPAVPGFEAAGVVTEIDAAQSRLKVGDRVGYFFAEGAYADLNVVKASSLVALPDHISAQLAAAFLAKGLTAWMGLRVLHEIKASEVILVQGASGNVGSILTRWARALGATVIGVAGSAQKLPLVAAGSTLALTAGDPELLAKVRALAPKGVDAVYDFVGDATFASSVAAVRDGGKILALGAASGPATPGKTELTRRAIELRGGSTPQIVNAGNQIAAAAELFGLIEAGVFADLVITQRRLDEAADVHRLMDARRLPGLTVLLP
jgi:NADPH2:quinone reductase